MSEHIIEVEAVAEEIVRCPKCGQRNRLYRRKKGKVHRCGRCQTAIANPFASRRRVKRLLIRATAVLGGGAVLGLIVWGGFLVWDRERFRAQPADSVPAPSAPRALDNGVVLQGLERVGFGTLAINNGMDSDVVVKLVNGTNVGPDSVMEFYIQQRHTATLRAIPEGRFRVMFSTGADWDSILETFTRDDLYFEFDKTLNNVPTDSQHELALGGPLAAKAPSSPITKVDFMHY
jgi:ribosomal protein L37AE/L43A